MVLESHLFVRFVLCVTDNKCPRVRVREARGRYRTVVGEVASAGAKMTKRRKVVVCGGIYRRIIIFVFDILRK